MPQSPDSNSNTVFGHSRYKVEPTDEDSKIIDLVPRINLESSRLVLHCLQMRGSTLFSCLEHI